MEFTWYDPVLSLGPAPTSLLVARIPPRGHQSSQKLLTVLVECPAITHSRVSSQLSLAIFSLFILTSAVGKRSTRTLFGNLSEDQS